MKLSFLIFTTQHLKMGGYVKSVLHSLQEKVTGPLRKGQEILGITY